MNRYDYLIVGAGLFGSTCARMLTDAGFKVLVIEKREHVAGNIFTKLVDGIHVHSYGAHIFHTSNEKVWSFINKYCQMNNFVNSPLANYNGELYHLPFNMNTFQELWGVSTPEEAKTIINKEIKTENIKKPINLEEQALSMVGRTIYVKLIEGYTEKQWGRKCKDLPPFIIKRLPVRFEFNNNYFNDKYQGIPVDGYTNLVEKLLYGSDVRLNTDYLTHRNELDEICEKIIYTGPIDEFFGYCFGPLEYRSLNFIEKRINIESFQNNAVVNYTSCNTPYTRIIEHKFFINKKFEYTIISEEYPKKWVVGNERFYPINDEVNNALFNKYFELAKNNKKIIFGGRLGLYKYNDMDDTIEDAMNLVDSILRKMEE